MTDQSEVPDETTERLELAEGAHVYSADGEELGTLAGTEEGYFKVDVSMGSDFWLPFDTVARNEGNDVYLKLDKGEVEGRKFDSAAEDLDEASLDASQHGPAVEQRYETEAEMAFHPRPRL